MSLSTKLTMHHLHAVVSFALFVGSALMTWLCLQAGAIAAACFFLAIALQAFGYLVYIAIFCTISAFKIYSSCK